MRQREENVSHTDRQSCIYYSFLSCWCIHELLSIIIIIFKFAFKGKFLQLYRFVPTTSITLDQQTLLYDLNPQSGQPSPAAPVEAEWGLAYLARPFGVKASWVQLDLAFTVNTSLHRNSWLNCKVEASWGKSRLTFTVQWTHHCIAIYNPIRRQIWWIFLILLQLSNKKIWLEHFSDGIMLTWECLEDGTWALMCDVTSVLCPELAWAETHCRPWSPQSRRRREVPRGLTETRQSPLSSSSWTGAYWSPEPVIKLLLELDLGCQ